MVEIPVNTTAKHATCTRKNGIDDTQLTRSSDVRVSDGSVEGIDKSYRYDPVQDEGSPSKFCDLRVCNALAVNLELTTLHVGNASGVATVTIDHAPMNLLDAGAQTRAGELDLDATLRTAALRSATLHNTGA